jgi:hypothetical protein
MAAVKVSVLIRCRSLLAYACNTVTSHWIQLTRDAAGYNWSAGDVFDGFMEGNTRHGPCIYTFFNGLRLECHWSQGSCPQFNEVQQAVLAKFSVGAAILQRIGVGGTGGVAAAVQRLRAGGACDA